MPQQPILYDSGVTYDDPAIRWDGFMPVTSTFKIMATDNRISAEIAPAEKTAFLQAITDATAKIPFAVNLTPTERQRIPSIGIERAGMLDAFGQEMTANAALVPSFVDMTEVNKDIALFRDLMAMRQSAAVLLEKLDDTMKITSADAFSAFSTFYAVIKDARRRNVPGADAIYQRLSPYFARTAPTPPPATPAP